MEKEFLFELGLIEIQTEEHLTIGGGTEIGYWLGYYFTQWLTANPGDKTRYGGAYLETVSGRSSIM